MNSEKLIHGEKYDILLGADLSAAVKNVIEAPDTFLITDAKVEKLYGHLYNAPRYILSGGETSKTLQSAGKICEAMLKSGCNRKTTVIAVGGGVVGDIAGFAAGIYMRGVKVIQIPTTLLAMVDSSIGGKTGVNMTAKNIVGLFHQPKAIITSLHFLKTLPNNEVLCGIGEIFKTALLDKAIYTDFKALINGIKGNKELIANLDGERLAGIIEKCIRFKLDVVTKDETEQGLRKILNVGHTIGHALETYDKYRLTHGEYIIQGISVETEIAKDIGLIDKTHYTEVKALCGILSGGEKIGYDVEKLAAVCAYDKKNTADGISIMLSYSPGKTEEVMLKQDELVKTLLRIKN